MNWKKNSKSLENQEAGKGNVDTEERREIAVLEADPGCGLGAEEVRLRVENGYVNRSDSSPTKSVGDIIKSNTFTFFNLVFVVLGGCLIAVGSYTNLLFLVIAAANTFIGIFQEVRSKRAVDRLTLLAEQKIHCIRDGEWEEIPSSELVRDDIVEFDNGSQICADAVICSGQVTVNESLLTGETDAILKQAGDELKSGSFVNGGRCVARLSHVGSDSYASRLAREAKSDVKLAKSEMMRSLDRLIRVIGILLIPVGICLFINQHQMLGLPVKGAVEATVAALIGMIPEGLYLLTSIAIAVGVLRLSRRKVLVRDMNCVEILARVDTLCVDKTGTITEPGMDVDRFILLDEENFPEEAVTEMLAAFYDNMDADNDTGRAMAERFRQDSDWEAADIVPFTSDTKWSGITFEEHGSFLIGAPEFIMGSRLKELKKKIRPWAEQGMRVLLAAAYDGNLKEDGLQEACIRPMALILITNRLRGEAAETFRYFKEQGVSVRVISGDNPSTVSEVARQAGIEGAELYVDASTLKTESSLEAAAEKYRVFGRVTPEQKCRLVKALQKNGHTVAMTGDGVNDVLALKEADCGIAMASGSQAACQIAQLVLLNSDFQSMPAIVGEGRRVINNIQRAASLFLVKNIFSFLLSLVSLFAGFPYPLLPLQLSLIGSLTIGIPSFFLALEPNSSRVEGHFMSNVFYKALPGGLTNLFLVLGIELFTYAFDFPVEQLYSISAVTVLFVGLLVLYQVCRPFDWKRRTVWGVMTVAALVCVVFFGELFGIRPLTLQTALVLAVFLFLAQPAMHLALWLFEQGNRLYRRLKKYGTENN